MNPVYINLGCGSRIHHEWLNFDLHSSIPTVRNCDVSRGVPLPNDHCDAIFNSALLEHLPPAAVGQFLAECLRILKPGGILRIGVPDLERTARTYLAQLDRCLAGEPDAVADYDWILLELIDQMIRTTPGGRMAEFIGGPHPNGAFIERQIGLEYRELKAGIVIQRAGMLAQLRALPPRVRRHKIWRRIKRWPGGFWRSAVSQLLGPADRRALQLGRFRMSGEIHLWMYDRYSLPRLVAQHGFKDARLLVAGNSAIPDWRRFRLDVDANGAPLKPDLIYVEARK